jgi:hypothetical protein
MKRSTDIHQQPFLHWVHVLMIVIMAVRTGCGSGRSHWIPYRFMVGGTVILGTNDVHRSARERV